MRRVVTGTTEDGTSTVLFDAEPPTKLGFPPSHVVQLWATYAESPVVATDVTIDLPLETDLPPGASRWVFLEFGPGATSEMHETATVDFAYVIDGAITLRLDDGDVVLTAGDVLVQQATRHAWLNDREEPCRMLVHVLSIH
jgi:quercetin dioxygenase-like cupin family protein